MDNRKLAKKGRYGDTHIRDVYGIKSHVNKKEAELIDSYGILGEIVVGNAGAGTINPLTGFPEYHDSPRGHRHTEGTHVGGTTSTAGSTIWDEPTAKITKDMIEGLSEEEAIYKVAEERYGWTKGTGIATVGSKWKDIRKEVVDSGFFSPTEFGAASISKEDFVNADGTMKEFQEIVDSLSSKFPDKDKAEIIAQVRDHMPKYEGVAKEEKGFLAEERKLTERGLGLGKEKAEDAYGLGVSAAGRAYGAAGDVFGAAQETFGLGQRAAGRGLETGLGKMQQQAGQAGAQMRGAYGGMGGGMRGAMGAQASMAKGVEQTYDVFTDQQTALKGAMGRAESAYGRAGEARGDEMTRLGQERGYAGTAYDIGMDKAGFAERRGLYGLEKEAAGAFEGDVAGFIDEWREGGLVPNKKSKKTFLDILSDLPDAGGS